MNADTSWKIWSSDLYSALNTSMNHESPGTAGFKYADRKPHQTPAHILSISSTSPLKKPRGNQPCTGSWVMRRRWQNHSTPFLRGHWERRPEQEGRERSTLESTRKQLEGQRERKKHRMKKKKLKELFVTVLNPQNPKVNKPIWSLWRGELILRHVDYASNSEACETFHWIKK